MFRLILSCALCAPLLAVGAELPEVRHLSTQERAAFDAFYRARFNDVPLGEPAFAASRPAPGKPWTVTATLDSPPKRGVGALCRMQRSLYHYEPRAAVNERWRTGATRQFAWLDKVACSAPKRPVEMLQAVPDTALLPLLEQHGVMLLKARLLFAGNTSCAPMRSLRFHLTGIDVGAAPGAAEQLYALVFDSDRDTQARVYIKFRANEWNAWGVACVATPHGESASLGGATRSGIGHSQWPGDQT